MRPGFSFVGSGFAAFVFAMTEPYALLPEPATRETLHADTVERITSVYTQRKNKPMEPTIGINVRLPLAEYEALNKIAGHGQKNAYVRGVLKKDLQRRKLLPAGKRNIRRKA